MGSAFEVRSGSDRTETRPSPVFLAILAAAVLSGLIAWRYRALYGEQAAQISVFAFVMLGWIVSLCLHEFGHAYLAYRSGDHSIATKGYLTLNPLKYGDPILSFALPVLFVLLGGIGLPGGAVWIERHRISGRLRHSLISAAGPLANLGFALLLAVAVSNLYTASHMVFWSAVGFLAFLQITAALLNLLPVPGLDGFGIIEPFLPRRLVDKANEVGGYGFFILLALLWIPPINDAFFGAVFNLTDLLQIDRNVIADGYSWLRFWQD